MIAFGVSPRGTIDLLKACKATAYLRDCDYVTPVDIGSIFNNTIRHRIGITYEAEAENITSDDILSEILKTIPIP
jgi:MoxR-like ATPase